ncbi:DNA-directed RNA polymerase subunit delta [Bacillus dakarensis]|uniref:DNA-directed RNA polymerase subunit delta n=1 Tax=Robertmurraya dakarensis TaxID=1926278 RepID=UPI0009821D6A|nr:DNA-directed RNA polymerase subunit delta [Bacillus dakarensis]
MSLNQYTQEQLKEMSWIEIAFEVLNSNKQPAAFKEIVDEIAKALDLSDEEVKKRIAQFYTDLNIDGRFMALGENRWGLRVWYPVDQTEEDTVTQAKPKKKKAKKKVVDEDDDLDLEDYDELDEEDVDFDDIDETEDDFDDIDEDDDDDDDDDDIEDADDFEDEDDLLDEDEEFEELDEEDEDPDSDEEDDF